jgi:hypothetical protein
MSYEEEDTCMSYEEEDTCMSYEGRIHALYKAAARTGRAYRRPSMSISK